MKTFSLSLLALSLLNSAQAFACPNLAGSYHCANGQSQSADLIVLSQSLVSGIWNYTSQITDETGQIKSGTVQADGISHVYTDSSGIASPPTVVSCNADLALVEYENYVDPQTGATELNVQLSLDAQGNLHQIVDAKTEAYGAFHSEQVCNHL